MFTWIQSQLKRIPQPYRTVTYVVIFAAAISGFLYLFSQIQSCGYDKARVQYQKNEDDWKVQRTKLIADAEAREKHVAELETKVQAYEATIAASKKIDEDLVKKIDQLGKDTANAEANAQIPTDCSTRAQRVCDLLRANHITNDCAPVFAECSK